MATIAQWRSLLLIRQSRRPLKFAKSLESARCHSCSPASFRSNLFEFAAAMDSALSWLQGAVAPPTDHRLRQAQHIACLLAGGYVLVKAVQMGPSAILKQALTLALPALEAVPGGPCVQQPAIPALSHT